MTVAGTEAGYQPAVSNPGLAMVSPASCTAAAACTCQPLPSSITCG